MIFSSTKTILIPTDFTIASLKLLKLALATNLSSDIRYKIVLTMGHYLSSSISDLLFFSPSKIIKEKNEAKFEEALEIIKNRFESSIEAIHFKIFTGLNQNSFNHFLEANKIDIAYTTKSYKYQYNKNGFDVSPYFLKSKIELIELNWRQNSDNSEELDSLFN
jgi:hypothetical protein